MHAQRIDNRSCAASKKSTARSPSDQVQFKLEVGQITRCDEAQFGDTTGLTT